MWWLWSEIRNDGWPSTQPSLPVVNFGRSPISSSRRHPWRQVWTSKAFDKLKVAELWEELTATGETDVLVPADMLKDKLSRLLKGASMHLVYWSFSQGKPSSPSICNGMPYLTVNHYRRLQNRSTALSIIISVEGQSQVLTYKLLQSIYCSCSKRSLKVLF